MNPLAEKYLRKSALPTLFCPGCGHGTVLNLFLHVIDELDIFDHLGLVSGIGCSSWVPVFVDTDVLHTLHGRPLAVATGLKLANPALAVVVFTGDGDCIGIGGNHLIHAARRNIDITVVMLDNTIYGMTGGQVSPTTPVGARTQTTPYGNPDYPLDACALAQSAGATFVARSTTAHPRGLLKILRDGIRHKGFSFVHVLSQCPTQAGRYIHGLQSPGEHLAMLKRMSVPVAKAAALDPAERQQAVVIGRLHRDTSRQEYAERLWTLADARTDGKDD